MKVHKRTNVSKKYLYIQFTPKSRENLLEANEEYPVPNLDEEDNKNNTIDGQELEIEKTEDNTWLHIPLKITVKSPVIISKRTVGNITETLDYIPGTHLLSLVMKKLGHLGVNLGSAIARGDLLVTNATLEVGGQQGRPVPLALFYEKLGGGIEKGGTVYNRFVEFPSSDKQLKGFRAGYIGSTNPSNLPEYAKVNLTVGTHNTIEDKYQRPTSDVGGVYSYQAIQSGTKLQAQLRVKKSLAAKLSKNNQNWQNFLKGEERLGQSKKDDYGAVDIEYIEVTTPKKNEIQIESNQGKLTVWLLSDVLIRDERLRPSTSIEDLKKELESYLGVELESQKEEGEKLSLIARQNRLESWQVRWGLPRPSLVGLAAGTCVVFKIKDYEKIDQLALTELTRKLAEIEVSGIGERRAEGYGQISFNDPILLAETSKLEKTNQHNNNQSSNSSSHPSRELVVESDRAFAYARIIEKAAWRESIRRAVLEVAASDNHRLGIKADQPTMSQLGAFRSILRQLQKPEESGYVTKWLNNLEDTPNREDKWSSQTRQEIRTLISNENYIWSILNLDFASITL